MDLRTDSGCRIQFTGLGGYEQEREQAKKELAVGGEYTVDRIEVGGWSSRVYLRENGKGYNTVLFKNHKDYYVTDRWMENFKSGYT